MAKKEERNELKKGKEWTSSFVLVGEAKIGDYTYKIDEKSERSDWIYNSLNLGVYCGETCGTVYAELMGGYGAERDNVVMVHGKKENGRDDFENRFNIDWDDRFDENLLESVGDLSFITIGLERDKNGKVYYKKFLTPYDAIAYVKDNLKPDTIINVRGNLKYSLYNDEVTVKKEINSIVVSRFDTLKKEIAELDESIKRISSKEELSQIEQNNLKKKMEELDSKEAEFKKSYNPIAKFTQTILLTKDSIGSVDKTTGTVPIYAKVLDYIKEYKGKELKCNIPYDRVFEFEIDPSNVELSNKKISGLFKVQKDVTEATFEGVLIEGGATTKATEDDLPEDIKNLVEIGVFTLEEVLDKCTVNSGRERRMVIVKPLIKMVEEKEGEKTPKRIVTERKYTEEDLFFDFMTDDEVEDEDKDEDNSAILKEDDEDIDSLDDDSWLDSL